MVDTSSSVAFLDDAERLRRRQRKDAFHLAASHNRMDPEDLDYDYTFNYLMGRTGRRRSEGGGDPERDGNDTKARLIRELAATGGDVTTPVFQQLLESIVGRYDAAGFDARTRPRSQGPDASERCLEGMWLTLSKPNYPGCLGRHQSGGYLYSLGHMTMNAFPSKLVCCIDGTFNPIHNLPTRERRKLLDVPEHLKPLVLADRCALRSSE